ncbi:MAG: hypothetical protein SGARI_001058 [Bacillariaceae sp.]
MNLSDVICTSKDGDHYRRNCWKRPRWPRKTNSIIMADAEAGVVAMEEAVVVDVVGAEEVDGVAEEEAVVVVLVEEVAVTEVDEAEYTNLPCAGSNDD